MLSAHYYCIHLYLCETERNSIYIDVGHNESLIELHSCSPRALESWYIQNADQKNALSSSMSSILMLERNDWGLMA